MDKTYKPWQVHVLIACAIVLFYLGYSIAHIPDTSTAYTCEYHAEDSYDIEAKGVRYIVTLDGDKIADFDTINEARAFITGSLSTHKY